MSSNEPYASSSSIDRHDESLHERAPLLPGGQSSGSRKDKGKATIAPQNYTEVAPTPAIEHEEHISRPRRNKSYYVLSILSTIVLLTVIIGLLFAPNIAQRYLRDGAEVSFDEASILNISNPESLDIHVTGKVILNDRLFGLSQKASDLFGQLSTLQSALNVYKSAKPDTRAANDPALGTIVLPELLLEEDDRTTNFSFTSQFRIGDKEQLAAFCQEAVKQKEVIWRVNGPVGVKVGWFPKTLAMNIEKDVVLEGMDGLQQAELKSMSFPGEHPKGGIIVEGQVSIYNPSSTLSFKLGNVDFGIFAPIANTSRDALIAIVRAQGASLLGKKVNTFNVTGRTIPIDKDDMERKRALENFLSDYLKGESSIFHVRGSERGPDDDENSDLPDWMKKALSSVTLAIPFPGSAQKDFIESLAMSNISIDFATGIGTVVSGSATALMRPPPEMKFDINVESVKPVVYLYMKDDYKTPFAKLAPSDASPAKTSLPRNDPSVPQDLVRVESNLERVPLILLPDGDDDLQKFLDKTFYGSEHKVYIGGTVDAQVASAFGNLSVKDLAFKGEITTKGLCGLSDPPPRLDSIELNHGYPDALRVYTNLSLFNPSDVTVTLGPINNYLLYDGGRIGNATLANHTIVPGWNAIHATAFFTPNEDGSREKAMEFLSTYLSGQNQTNLTISGDHPNSSASPMLQTMLRNFKFSSSAPPMNHTLLVATQINIFSSTAELWLVNPFNGTTIEVLAVNATASYRGLKVGTVHADFEDLSEGWTRRLILPSNGTTVHTEKLPVMFEVGGGFEAIRKAVGKSIEVDVDSIIRARLDDLHIYDLQYHKSNVSARVRLFQ